MDFNVTTGLASKLAPELTKAKKAPSFSSSPSSYSSFSSKNTSFDTQATPTYNKNDAFSKGVSAGLNRFSSLFSKAVKPGSIPQSQTANSTPQIYNNLNPDFKKLGTITTKWGDSTRYEKSHPGVDIANKFDTPIPAFLEGTVTAVDTGHKHGEKGYGNTITVTDQWGNKHRYSHLNQVFVKVGQKVGKGQQVATMGDTGSTYSASGKGTGTHLDYRIVDAYNKYINPFTYLKKLT